MENSTARLYQAARELKDLKNTSQIARAFNTSSQTIKNWELREISKQGLLKAQRIIGVSAHWLETGKGKMLLDGSGELITIDQFDIQASYGLEIKNVDYPDLIRSINISEEKFLEWFGHSKGIPEIKLMIIKDYSMEPTLPNRAIAFVDSNINEFQGDGIYVFVLDGEAYFKRLQRIPGKFIAISDNTVYEPFYITPEMEETMQIAAKFIKVLPFNMREL